MYLSTVDKQHQPAPALDEAYWQALLNQDEEEWQSEYEAEGFHSQDLFPDLHPLYGSEADWEVAEAAFQGEETLDLKVVGFNRGGLLVEWQSLRGFVPCSQLLHECAPAEAALPSMESYLGQVLALRIIELGRAHNRLIFSERAAQNAPGARAALFRGLRPDTCLSGRVTNICDFGVFVDLGGVEGLIHISELSWGRVESPGQVVQRGQKLRVYVMEVEPERGRVALSLKRLQADPWLQLESRYQVGQEVEGIITTVVDFGAFLALEDGLEGLIHISELAEGQFLHPRNVVQEGQRLRAKILNLNPQARRIGLSLRACQTPT
jgi:small subunit ribosomal protein S1